MDEQLIEDYTERFTAFIADGEKVLDLPPMNSYQRRLIHQLAVDFGLETSSIGEGADRHIQVRASKGSKVPEKALHKPKKVWHYGDKEFFVDSLAAQIEVYLSKDGTIGLWMDDKSIQVIDRKVLSTPSFKIKNNKIVEITDPEW